MKCDNCGGLYEKETSDFYINVQTVDNKETKIFQKPDFCPECIEAVKKALQKRAS